MSPELALFSVLTCGATALPRERVGSLIIGSRWTCDSETRLSATSSQIWVNSTGNLEATSAIEDVIRGASKLVRAVAQALPPVDHEAEARIDRLMAKRQESEQRKPLLRKV